MIVSPLRKNCTWASAAAPARVDKSEFQVEACAMGQVDAIKPGAKGASCAWVTVNNCNSAGTTATAVTRIDERRDMVAVVELL